jgi:hypothetical protein
MSYNTALPWDWLFAAFVAFETRRIQAAVDGKAVIMMGVATYEEPGWTFHPEAPSATPARGRHNSALPSTPTGPPPTRNGQPIGTCGAASPKPRILHAELALCVRLRHLSVSPTGERASNAPQEKNCQTKSPGAQARAADFESHATKAICREKNIHGEEDGRPQEETGAKDSKAEIPAG